MALAEKKRLGDILVNSGKITSEQLQEALKAQKALGKKLGEVLVSSGVISDDEIVDCIKKQTGIESINLNTIIFDKKVFNFVSEKLCNKYMLIPFGFENNRIKVAFADPLNIFAIDDVTISSNFEVQSFIANKEDIQKFIKVYYSSKEVSRAAEQLTLESKELASKEETTTEDITDINNAPVVKMVDFLFKNAVDMRASDIHIEPFEKYVRIRYRIDGELQNVNSLGIGSLSPLVTRIKILASLNIAEKRIPQDGRIITRVGNNDVDLRVSILPVVNGEKVVIRILNRSNYSVGRERLGMGAENFKKLDRIISSPHGIVLVTGPTGSGKSTTLYTVLSELNKEDVNIVTVEDPVEYALEGINQVNVHAKAGLTFAAGLRSILRQDPDIVMIGEIRDDETAQIATKAAITGHLVLSTLHTNDAPSSILRLIDMGIEPYLVSTSITGVIAQRLVRRICPNCSEPYKASDSEKKMLIGRTDRDIVLHRGKGCGYCNGSGYSGRVGVYELMEINREIRDLISAGENSNILKDAAMKNGMSTLAMEGKKLVLQGVTTIQQLATITMVRGD